MGCDGGTIPRRDELVKTKKKPEARDKDSELAFRWRHCSISQQVLEKPIVMCGLGQLYNKTFLIEALITKSSSYESIKHIKSLKDVKELNLTSNPAYNGGERKEGEPTSDDIAPYICPVIGLEMAGKFRFVGIWSCGCVFSERALKEIDTTICHKCQKSFTQQDVVVLNGNEEDLALMRSRLSIRQQKTKKIKVKSTQQEDTIKEDDTKKVQGQSKLKMTRDTPSTSTSTTLSSLQKRPGALVINKDTRVKKMKPDYSVAKDPNASDVYKSLFTSHKSEQEQNRAHWVTYNPFYN
ncbi:replication termination factor 2 [Onthophagus taurus]|uniref:replication termination factor 2 n=1 Tax=Onthophagus taurus TaxID=166361 RepID=UPI0039BE1EA7